MNKKFTYWHLDGTWCPAGWDAETGKCSQGGGEVTPRVLEGELPMKVEPVTILMVALFDWNAGVHPYGFFTDEHAASVLLRRLMGERKRLSLHPKSFFSIQPYTIGQEYGRLEDM